MKSKILVLTLILFSIVFGQSNHTVTFTGSASDFTSAEKIYGGDDVDYYVTFDGSAFYIGAFRVNSPTFAEYDHFTVYFDTDPVPGLTTSGNGTTTGVNWDSKTPTLPFRADYRACIRRANSGESFLSNWTGSAWNTTGSNGKGWTQYTTDRALEVRIPFTDIGSPAGVYFAMYMSYGNYGGGFYGANNSPTYPITFSGSTMSGYFGGIGLSAPNCTPVSYYNTPITASLSNATPASGAKYGKVTFSTGTIGTSGSFSIASGGSMEFTGGTLNIGSTDTVYCSAASKISQTGGGFGAASNLGWVKFSGSNTLSGTLSLYKAVLTGSVNFGSDATITNTLKMQSGSSVVTNAPKYGTGSLLLYNSGGTFSRSLEWSASSGAGYPQYVQLSGNTKVDLSQNSGGARVMAADLTIDSGSELTLNAMAASLTVNGNLTNNGTLTLSTVAGGDLTVKGNFTTAGTVNHNTRQISFAGSTEQLINGLSAIDYLEVNNTAGVKLGSITGKVLTIGKRLLMTAGNLTTDVDTVMLGSTAVLQNEGANRYVIGVIGSSRSVTSGQDFGGIGPVFASGTDIGTVASYRLSGAAGAVTANGHTGINRQWRVTRTGTGTFASRQLTFNWVSNDDNSKDLTTSQIFRSADNGTTWSAISHFTNASTTRSVSTNDTLVGYYTISDVNNPLGYVPALTTIAAGNWSSPSIWNGNAVPNTGADVIINHNVTLDMNASVTTLTVNSGKTFTASDATPRTLTIAAGGSLLNSGTFVPAGGTVLFSGAGSVGGTTSLNNVTISNGVDFGSATTINGTLRINTGGYVNTNAPIYGTGATLQYATGGVYGRSFEWKDTTGAGYPYNVQMSNNTILNLGNGGAAVYRRIAGSLTIDAGSAVTMDTLGASMSKALEVKGSVLNNGRLLLSFTSGGDLNVGGNFTNNGVFTANGRAINFNGSALQNIVTGSSSATTVDNMIIANSNSVALNGVNGHQFTVNGTLNFAAAGLNLITNTDTLVLGSSGYITGETGSKYVSGVLKTTRSLNTDSSSFGGSGLYIPAGSENLGSVTVYRVSGSGAIAGTDTNTGIARQWRVVTTGVQSFTARQFVFSWPSGLNNGRDLSMAQLYKSNDNGATWSMASNYVNASSQQATAAVTSPGYFTFADIAHVLGTGIYYAAIHNGNWNTAGTWNLNAVPPSNANVTIYSNVTLDKDAAVDTLTITSGKIFTASDATPRTLTVASGGLLQNNGTFTHAGGSVVFAGTGTVSGTTSLNNVTISNGVNFGTAGTVNGIFRINAGGYVNTNPPIYGTGATLQYASSGVYGRSNEWKDTSGAGYPYNVQISNNTILNLGNGAAATYRRIAGSLTIDAGCALTMDTLSASMSKAFEVKGNVLNNGRLLLSFTSGGDLTLAGNFTNNGLFNTNGRAIIFNGSSQQKIAAAANASTTVDYLLIQNAAGVALNGVGAGVLNIQSQVNFNGTAGNLVTNADTLVLGSSASVAGEAAGREIVGLLRVKRTVGTGSTTFGSIGASINAGADNLGDVTVLRTTGTGGIVTSGGNSGIARTWKISNSGSQTFAGRLLTLSWLSSDDNSKDAAKSQLFTSADNGSSWIAAGMYQNASASRADTATITSFKWYTVSDSAHSLAASGFTLHLTALLQGFVTDSTMIPDTLTVILRGTADPYVQIASARVLVTAEGKGDFSFTGIQNGTPYYVCVSHRNSVYTWSAQPQEFTGNTLTYDFTTAASQAYGDNQILVNTKYCIYSGDVNQDGNVDFTDMIAIDNDSYNYATGYLDTDVNGDLSVDFNDMIIIDNNSYNYVATVGPPVTPAKMKKPHAVRPAHK
ncbi:MAG: hypothetical protein LWX56_06170 [Ignavibacteria bacterium]|nr:hypothetical protein [Ignavibacteria bacterium]